MHMYLLQSDSLVSNLLKKMSLGAITHVKKIEIRSWQILVALLHKDEPRVYTCLLSVLHKPLSIAVLHKIFSMTRFDP